MAGRSQFDSSVPLQILAVDIMFFYAYYVTFLFAKMEKNRRDYIKRS